MTESGDNMDCHLVVKRGDMTKMPIDAIINSANTSLYPGSGLSGAIHKAAGAELYEDCKKYGHLGEGEAIITPAYHLPCKFVIHTVAPKWYVSYPNKEELLKNCYINVLKLAVQNHIKDIAIPCVGMGIYRCPLDSGAKIAVDTVSAFVESESGLQTIYFVCGNTEQYEYYQTLLQTKFQSFRK